MKRPHRHGIVRFNMMRIFSTRLGLRRAIPPVTVRDHAPDELRYLIPLIAERLGVSSSEIQATICDALPPQTEVYEWLQQPDEWDDEYWPIAKCAWEFVYDIIEQLYHRIATNTELPHYHAQHFSEKVNEYLRQEGIGWELRDGRVTARGNDAFDTSVKDAISATNDASMPGSSNELTTALKALSARPDPDLTGAITHASAALESVSKEVTGVKGQSLGQVVKRLDLPQPLDQAIEKMYGFASQHGRHVEEGRQPTFDDAQLVVHVASATVTYLLAKARD